MNNIKILPQQNSKEVKEILPMGEPEVGGITDPVEKLFARTALKQGLLIYEAEMIKLPGKKKGKWDKKSTIPDFMIKENNLDKGIYVEVTVNNDKSGKKNNQRRVMEEAGLSTRYVQLTMDEIQKTLSDSINLIDYIKNKVLVENQTNKI